MLKNKKNVNFDNSLSRDSKAGPNSSFRKDPKGINRDSSIGRTTNQRSFMASTTSSQKMLGLDSLALNQKIKVFLTSNGFIIEKKYIQYHLEAAFDVDEPMTNLTFFSEPSRLFCGQSEHQRKLNDDGPLTMHLLTDLNSLYLNINGVRHRYRVKLDKNEYLQIQLPPFCHISDIAIPNRRIDFIERKQEETDTDQTSFEKSENTQTQENDFTSCSVINPISLFQESIQNRKNKILESTSKSSVKLNICWNQTQQQLNAEQIQQSKVSIQNSQESGRYRRMSSTSKNQNVYLNESRKRISQQQEAHPYSNTDQCAYGVSKYLVNINRKRSNTKQFEKIKKIPNKSFQKNVRSIDVQAKTKQKDKRILEKQNKNEDYYNLNSINSKSRSPNEVLPLKESSKIMNTEAYGLPANCDVQLI